MSPRRGPDLPYSLVAGVTPIGSGWLVSSAKIAGATFAPEPPKTYPTFLDVLGERPAFSILVVNAPIGYLDTPKSGARTCDLDARELLGRRGSVIQNAPSRAVLRGDVSWQEGGLDAVTATMLPRYREVAEEMSPYRQRTIYEGNPELSFYQLNKDNPIVLSKRKESGRDERREVLLERIPGIDKVIDVDLPYVRSKHLNDAAALMWTARRVFGRAARRLPKEAEWDSEGLRMEIVI